MSVANCKGWVVSCVDDKGLFWSHETNGFTRDSMTVFDTYAEAHALAKSLAPHYTAIWPVLVAIPENVRDTTT
jgi:hypothetical protein